MSSISNVIGEEIRNLRVNQGFSQEKLAFKAGITPSYLGQVERGEKSPTLDTLDKVAQALNIEIAELFKSNTDTKMNKDTTYIEKINYQLVGRTAYEQEEVLNFIKRLLDFRDNK